MLLHAAGLQDNTDSEQTEFERRQFVKSMDALQQQSGQEEPRKEHYSDDEMLEFLAYVREVGKLYMLPEWALLRVIAIVATLHR